MAYYDLPQNSLFHEVRQLIDSAKQRAAIAINAEITLLYWQIGQRIHTEILQGQRAEYGKQILKTLSQQLTPAFSDRDILHTVCAELSWSQRYPLKNSSKPNFKLRSSVPAAV